MGDNSNFVFRQKLVGEDGSARRGVVMVKQPGLFSPKLGATSSHFFSRSLRKTSQYHPEFTVCPVGTNTLCKEGDDNVLEIAFHPSGLFGPW